MSQRPVLSMLLETPESLLYCNVAFQLRSSISYVVSASHQIALLDVEHLSQLVYTSTIFFLVIRVSLTPFWLSAFLSIMTKFLQPPDSFLEYFAMRATILLAFHLYLAVLVFQVDHLVFLRSNWTSDGTEFPENPLLPEQLVV
ncbi:hypothetical protein Tco_0816522 [Tanacetum coccineum]